MEDNEEQSDLASASHLEGPKRYAYFLSHVVRSGMAWSLWSPTGWLLVGDNVGREAVPLWPDQRSANAYAHVDGEQEYEAKSIELDALTTRWLPGMDRDKRFAAVFPTPANKGVIVPALRLLSDLGN